MEEIKLKENLTKKQLTGKEKKLVAHYYWRDC